MASKATAKNYINSEFMYSLQKRFIRFEICLVIVVSICVSLYRFSIDTDMFSDKFLGLPKTLGLPLIWLYFGYRYEIWERYLLLNSNFFYTRIFRTGISTLIVFSSVAFLTKYPISRTWIILDVMSILAFISISRFVTRRYLYYNNKNKVIRFIVIDLKLSKKEYLNRLKQFYPYEIELIFFPFPRLGSEDKWIEKYAKFIELNKPYGVILGRAAGVKPYLLRRLIDTKRNLICDFQISSQISGINNRLESNENFDAIRVRSEPIVYGGNTLKRLFDVVFSAFAIILLSPLFLIVAILIKLTSEGPIFYIDKRVGLNGNLFWMIKFRTMHQNANLYRSKFLDGLSEEFENLYINDPRITKVGRFLRRWSIDEIPQFWNILAGEMSVVGPRPILPEEIEQVPQIEDIRFLIKPGLTGIWQVKGRKSIPWEDRMLFDRAYVDNWNFWLDVVLIGRTLVTIFSKRGAY